MRCDQALQLVTDSLAAPLSERTAADLAAHLASCAACAAEATALRRVWEELERLPEEQPGAEVSRRFAAFLAPHAAAADRRGELRRSLARLGGGFEGWLGRWLPRRPLAQAGFAAAALALGLAIGAGGMGRLDAGGMGRLGDGADRDWRPFAARGTSEVEAAAGARAAAEAGDGAGTAAGATAGTEATARAGTGASAGDGATADTGATARAGTRAAAGAGATGAGAGAIAGAGTGPAAGAGASTGAGAAARAGAGAVAGAAAGKDEIGALRSEVRSLSQLVTLSLLKQDSASERLRGVSFGRQAGGSDERVLAALLDTLGRDPDVNVRLAALDALAPAVGRPSVRDRLLDEMRRQGSPLVQIALADLLLAHDGESSRLRLLELAATPTLDPTVRDYLRSRLHQLS